MYQTRTHFLHFKLLYPRLVLQFQQESRNMFLEFFSLYMGICISLHIQECVYKISSQKKNVLSNFPTYTVGLNAIYSPPAAKQIYFF
jgi:hypothetical protein